MSPKILRKVAESISASFKTSENPNKFYTTTKNRILSLWAVQNLFKKWIIEHFFPNDFWQSCKEYPIRSILSPSNFDFIQNHSNFRDESD